MYTACMIDAIQTHNEMSDDDKALLKRIETKFKESEKYRSTLDAKISEYEKFYDGDQWPTGSQRPVDNIIFQTVEGIVPIVTDSMPGTDVLARNPEKEDAAAQLQAHLNYCYEYNSLHLKLTDAVRKSSITGMAYFYASYDPHADDGQGMAIIKTLPWRSVYLDQLASNIDECAYVGIKIPMRIDEMKKMFPAKKDMIKAQNISLDQQGKVNGAKEDSHSNSVSSDDNDKYAVSDAAFLEEHWIKDYSMEAIPEEDTINEIKEESQQLSKGEMPELTIYENHAAHAQGHESELVMFLAQAIGINPEEVTPEVLEMAKQDEHLGFIVNSWLDHIELHQTYIEEGYKPERPKYPNFWRKIIKTGNLILEKQDDVFIPAGRVPLVPVYCYKDEDKIYGFGDVKNIIDDQKVINEMEYALLSNVRLLGNPQIVMDQNCEIDQGSVNNAPGNVYTKRQGTEFKVQQPPPLGGDFRAIREEKKQAAKDKSGMTDAAMGKSPGASSSGKMVRLLQEQAIGRIRLRSRLLESYTMTRLGLITCAYIQKYAIARKIRNLDESGAYVYVDYNPGEVSDLKYDIVTAPGTTAGPDREMIQQELKEALLNQWITFEDYIKAINPPYKRTILKSINARNETNARLQQLEEQSLMMRAKYEPQTLSEDELKLLQQLEQQNQGAV